MTPPYKIGIAGCGKMGAAMIHAWLASKTTSHIHILDPNGLPPDLALEEKITYCPDESAFILAAKNWDILVLAIKPQTMDAFAKSMQALPKDVPILSIAAGQSIKSLKSKFGSARPIIRAMPNTPASIGKGMTVACTEEQTSPDLKEIANNLLSKLGKMEWIKEENLMDAVTAVSGSGPAYVFYLVETLTEAGVKSGLDKALATTLARQTVIGAAALAEIDMATPAETLRKNVTSPGGTTEAALTVLMDGRFQSLMNEAVAKATARGKDLSR